jgi:hypothetical protein
MKFKPPLIAMAVGLGFVCAGSALGKSDAAGLLIMLGMSALFVALLMLTRNARMEKEEEEKDDRSKA